MQRALSLWNRLLLAVVFSGTFTWNVTPCLALWETGTTVDSTINLVVNGSFELGPDPGSYLPLNPGSTAIPGWIVTRGQIDYVGIWQDFEGVRSVDLDGTPGFGGIAQTIATTPGVEYRVTFAMAGNPHGPPEPKVMQVTAAGQSALFSFDATGTTYDSMAWQQKSWKFVATGTSAFLEFFSRDMVDGWYGPALDSVSVRAFPATVDSSVFALWHFDEGVGTTLHDASLYHNDGTILNASWVPGVSGSALRFDGLTAYVVGPNSASLRPAKNFVIDAWFAVDTFQFAFVAPPDSGGGGIFSNLGPYPWGGGYEVGVRESGVLRSDYRVGSPISRFSGYTQLSQTHHFYHTTVFYLRELQGADSMTVVKTYLDGVLTDSVAFHEQVQYAGTDNFYIGTNRDGRAAGSFGIREFPGVIDEISIRGLVDWSSLPVQPPDSARAIGVPLIVADGTNADTLMFGIHPQATECIDGSLGELELPPRPPSGVFDARFVNHRPPFDQVTCLRAGVTIDFRPSFGSAQLDTYFVAFQPGSAGYPMRFSWPPLADVYPGFVRLTDEFGGMIVDVDMRQETSYVLANTLVKQLFIVASFVPDSTVVPPDTAAQPGIPLIASSGVVFDTLFFGVHPAATYGLDPALGERELPPSPPNGVFDARLIEPRPDDAGTYFGQGVPVDLRAIVSSAQVDTYQVRFQPASGSFVTFTWPPLGALYAGPVRLIDVINGLVVNVDMKTQSSYTVTNLILHHLYIIAATGADSAGPSASYRTFGQTDYAQRAVRRWRPGLIPTAANVRDETFFRTGWYTAGLYLGIPRPDSTLDYGWVYFRHNIARLPRFLPHTGTPRGFDFYISGKPWHYSRANPAVKYHNNHLAGEQYALKFNVGASDFGLTPAGFGDLIFRDPSSPADPFNGRTVRELMAHADSVLTFCRRYTAAYFLALDSCLSRINAAFQGPITEFDPGEMTIAGALPLSAVSFLHPNPSPAARQPQPPVRYEEELPTEYALFQNYPNPFNPVTVIDFDLAAAAVVTLRVFNAIGQEVASVLSAVPMEQGRQSVEFDGGGLPSGMYFYRLELVGGEEGGVSGTLVRKMVLLR